MVALHPEQIGCPANGAAGCSFNEANISTIKYRPAAIGNFSAKEITGQAGQQLECRIANHAKTPFMIERRCDSQVATYVSGLLVKKQASPIAFGICKREST